MQIHKTFFDCANTEDLFFNYINTSDRKEIKILYTLQIITLVP